MIKRVFLIVLDSFGIGEMPDAALFGDVGSNTLGALRKHELFNCPNMAKLGLFHIDGVGGGTGNACGAYARMKEASMGKDSTVGHWEIAGICSETPLPTYPDGFPREVIDGFSRITGRGALCNKPYSGTDVIRDYGEEHLKTGDLIVYTSADSVFQIAAHESVVPVEELYRISEKASGILTGKNGVGRVIARPFTGTYPFTRMAARRDYSLIPPKTTMLDLLKDAGKDVISVGKIFDLFAGRGITESHPTHGNEEGMEETARIAGSDFNGLCFTNLVDFDMIYGHRNDISGYTGALSKFDSWLGTFLPLLRKEDVLVITADHGCDPSTPSTDHSREYTPCLIFGDSVKENRNLGTRQTFADIGKTVLDMFGLDGNIAGSSMLPEILK